MRGEARHEAQKNQLFWETETKRKFNLHGYVYVYCSVKLPLASCPVPLQSLLLSKTLCSRKILSIYDS